MIITRKELIDKLKTNWGLTDGLPNPTNIAIPRGEYWQPKIIDVEKFLKLDWTNEVDYILRTYACSNFSLNLHAQSKIYLHVLVAQNKVDSEDVREWAFGHCWGTKFEGRETSHAINIVFTSDKGIVFIEPQNDRWWEYVPGNDVIHFVEI